MLRLQYIQLVMFTWNKKSKKTLNTLVDQMETEEIGFCWSEQKSKLPFGSLSTQGNLNIPAWFSIAASICSLTLWDTSTPHLSFQVKDVEIAKSCMQDSIMWSKRHFWDWTDCLGLRFSILWAASILSPLFRYSVILFMTSVYHCGRKAWNLILVLHDSSVLLTGICLLFVPPFWKAEWEIFRADSLCVGEKIHPVSTKIIFLDSSIWSACHYCIEMPNHGVWKTGRIQSSVMTVVQIFIHGLH